ncbi:DNA-deoxyinosine glycosylase [Clostridium sp. KNHs216]|uniref:DNA-deoxyinosine glycosylase n=1 Tax=Clostridium sp. KNHs216 TaxID=1550235 RepID=UPI0011518E56|nr:DNA-deoxyinosine glycosylase [Clostridium sp. KNHs216]TQI65783.1 G/U mismatch-specific uracil-DNA glycosylase [Clostridium sp. KNHs216]
MTETVDHTFGPVYDENSRILILGTIPSPKSREYGFYYSHPQNRFWRIVSDLYGQKLPESNAEKMEFLLRNRIALWDVLKSCKISGADDDSIRDPVANDIGALLKETDIGAVFTTGTKAAALYHRFCEKSAGCPAVALPSTSPANCRHYNYESLREAYRVILKYTLE